MSPFSRTARVVLLSAGLLAAGAVSAGAAAPSSSDSAKAETLLTNALKATAEAKSVTATGQGTTSGKKVKVLLAASANDAYGMLTYSGQTTTIRRVGTTIYQKSTQGYLQQQGMSSSQAKVEANKWFKIPPSTSTTSGYSTLKQLLTVGDIVAGFLPPTAAGTISSISNSKVNGQPVEVIGGTFSGQKGTMYVATKGKPYVLRVTFGSSGGTTDISVVFSGYNKRVTTTVPKGAVTQ